MAIAALVLGIVGCIAWLLPIIGYPVTIIGLVLGVKAKKDAPSGKTTAAIVLCIVGLVLTVINSFLGVILSVLGLM